MEFPEVAIMSHLDVLTLLNRVGGQSYPLNLFLLLRDDVHGGQDVEGVVHSPSDVLLVNRLQ